MFTIQDHYFDVVTNIVGLVAAVLGDKFYWWIDPVGALILAIHTITNWSRTVMENAGKLLIFFFVMTSYVILSVYYTKSVLEHCSVIGGANSTTRNVAKIDISRH